MPANRVWTSETGFPIEAVYGPTDGTGIPPSLGAPGAPPYTRHIYKDGYRTRGWSPSLYSGSGSPEEANRRFRFLLEAGNGRANVATDLPTQIGLDSDDPEAQGEVGRVGVAIDSLADFEIMFDGVPLDRVPVSLNLNTTAPIFLALLVVTAEKQGYGPGSITGTMANDILHEYIGRGTWRYAPEGSLKLMADVVEYVTAEMPKFYPFNIRSIILHESGAHPGQEIGLTFAIACRYIDEVVARGIPIDSFAPRISFFFGMGLHFFEEAAKFRAARRLWSSLVAERYGTTAAASMRLRVTTVAPCGSHFTAADPELNLVRGTLGVLAGALGGVQAMLGTTIDEAFEIPTEETQRLALRTQQIVALETDICATADPLGGSYFVEAMTDAIELSAREEMRKVGGPEGIVDAVLAGQPQSALSERAYKVESEIASGLRPKVGQNIYVPAAGAPTLHLHEPEAGLAERKVKELQELRSRRDNTEVDRCVGLVQAALDSGENVVPALIEAVRAYATVGELSRVFDHAFGVYQQPVNL